MYDPLIETAVASGNRYPDSYWASHSGNAPENSGVLQQDISTDVVVIGAGYTGLSCALHLARDHKVSVTVVEANTSAWGCSGRNAGFILKSSGRKSYLQLASTYGEQTMRLIHQEMTAGVDLVKEMIALGIDCDAQSTGYLKLAHKPNKMAELINLAKLQQQMFGDEVEILTACDVKRHYMNDHNAYGAIRYNDGFGINPLKLAWGYQTLAQQAGVKIYTSTPATEITTAGQSTANKGGGKYGHKVVTPQGIVSADKVVIATNGYTPKGFHSLVSERTLPVLSQIIVTEPLSEEQLAACNLLTNNVVMDTRALKYYYRKLPDNRLLFGGRGAVTGKSADDPYYAQRLLQVLKSSFPPLATIDISYAWAGWICMSYDDIPHITHNQTQTVFSAMGYCGSGVSFSAQAGKRLAQRVAEQDLPDIPIYQTPLAKFPFAPMRRLGQRAYFHYGLVKDRWF